LVLDASQAASQIALRSQGFPCAGAPRCLPALSWLPGQTQPKLTPAQRSRMAPCRGPSLRKGAEACFLGGKPEYGEHRSPAMLIDRMRRTRSMTLVRSTCGDELSPKPKSAPRLASWTAWAQRINALLGVQPKLTQVPPVKRLSVRATRWPPAAATCAATRPAGPPPMATRS
jgi:hypothetical protein